MHQSGFIPSRIEPSHARTRLNRGSYLPDRNKQKIKIKYLKCTWALQALLHHGEMKFKNRRILHIFKNVIPPKIQLYHQICTSPKAMTAVRTAGHDGGSAAVRGTYQRAHVYVAVRTEGHDGGVAKPPLGALDVLVDERQDVRNNVVLAARRHQHEADARRLARVPVVIVVQLLLPTDGRTDGGEDGQSDTQTDDDPPSCTPFTHRPSPILKARIYLYFVVKIAS